MQLATDLTNEYWHLMCDACGGPLAPSQDRIFCPKCKTAKGTVQEGIPTFLDQDAYWGEIPRDQMQRLLTATQEIGWKQALKREVAETDPTIYEYATEVSRANFRYLVQVNQESSVLDIGCGLGLITQELAARCKRIVALDNVQERVAFATQRSRQNGYDNVWPLRGQFLETPLARNAFDLIIMNGVLEWFGLENAQECPTTIQARALRKAWELLRPGGYLYIGIENRIGYHAFRGRIDHSGIPYTSLLPRFMANWYMKRKPVHRHHSGLGYRTYTYSLHGYRKLLRQAGFNAVDVYAALPGYNQPWTLLPLETPGPAAYYFSRFSGRSHAWKMVVLLGRVLSPAFILRLFSDDFAFVAQRLAEDS